MKHSPSSVYSVPQCDERKVVIREMGRKDLERAGKILYEAFSGVASQHGYAPRIDSVKEGISWAWSILRHDPNEIFIAEIEDRVAGMCCLNRRGMHGGIGPVAVDPAFHGHGIGRQLMEALLKKAEGLESVRLFQEAFNPASFSLYYSLGLIPVASLMDLYAKADKEKRIEPCENVNELAEEDLDQICAYDAPRSRLDRGPDFVYYLKWGKVFVYRYRSEIRGYLASLPASRSVQLGPLVAEGEEEAQSLFQHALGVYSDRTSQTRVMARDHMLVSALHEMGFKLYCLDLLMVRGSWRPSRYIEAFGRFPEGA